MKIETLYRSTVRPAPLWTECALYCGYTHLEICKDIWVSRDKEYLVREAIARPDMSNKFKDMLSSRSDIYYPSIYETYNYYKMLRMLNRLRTFSVIGYSPALERFLQTHFYTTIYTDSNYNINHVERVSTTDLASSTSHVLTLISEDCTSLKPLISNWGNVIVYSNSMFIDDENLVGGIGYVTTNKTAESG